MPVIPEPKILRRFEQVRLALRRRQAWLGLAATTLAMATAFGLLAWLDYRLELPRSARAGGLALAGLATLAVMARWLVAPLRWWTRPRTAAEIEGRFPELGQRIRTVVQFAGLPDERIAGEGVRPSLLEALHEEAEGRANPLPLTRVVRWRRPFALSALAAVPVAVLATLAATDPEWRIALGRALLIERPYTTILVKPGDVLVDQGQTVAVAVELRGRARKSVLFQTRPLGKAGAPWKAEKLADLARGASIEKVKDPVEYRVVAGPAESPTHAIRVRYPLAIQDFEVEVKHPAYTGIEPRTTKGGDVQALEGSVASFRITFDAPPSSASLELVDPSRKPPGKGEPAPGPTVLPLRLEGNALVATLDLTRDLDYHVAARTLDGRVLPKKKYRIDVREDRAPRVAFDEPDEALEVHPIAEVRHRARVDDDFGLTRAGIVFRFNDGEEKALISKDYPTTPGRKPKVSDRLEEILLLETLAATPQDCVTYYAFAEDNFPGTPRRTETDLRYIDLRAFKREYKLAEPGSGDGDPQELIVLDELIARQRVNLNRATRLAKRRPTDRTEADDPLKIAGFEEALLTLTKEFTEGVEALADARVEALHKAIDAMQASMDALDRSRNADAPPAMAEAHRQLVAARRELATLIGEDSPLAARLRAFDRRQAQKIRKPKTKDEEAEEIAERLEALAAEEDFVYATLAANPGGTEPAPQPSPEAKEGEKAEPKDAPKKEGEPKDAKDAAEAKEPAKGQDGPKGEAGPGPKGNSPGSGPGDEGEGGPGDPKKLDRRALADKQREIADEVRDLEEKLKRLEVASDLAKARIAQAAEKVEQASGAMTRGNTKGATDDAKAAAGMLHELARQVKGEIAREAADQLAMARDLAEELARREADLADREGAAPASSPGPPSDPPGAGPKGEEAKKGQGGEGPPEEKKDGAGKAGQGDQPEGEAGKGSAGKGGEGPGQGEGKDGQGQGEGQGAGKGKGRGSMPGPGGRGAGPWAALTEAEQVERMAEMARTLEEWLQQIDKRGEGKAAGAVREILDAGTVAEVVEAAERMGGLRVAGKGAEVGREARELAARLEALGRTLGMLHEGVVAPELAAIVELDRRLADLNVRLGTLKTKAEAAAWERDAAGLVRDLEKAGVAGADALADALRVGGGWHWDDRTRHLVATAPLFEAVGAVTVQIKDRVQELILKDLASARDEATPPKFRELVERYYEVISRGAKAK